MPVSGPGSNESVWRRTGDGIELRIRLTPRAAGDGMEGVIATSEGPVLKARVRAVPEDNKANRAIEALVASWLGVAKSDVGLVGGARSRLKTILVSGDPDELAGLISARMAMSK